MTGTVPAPVERAVRLSGRIQLDAAGRAELGALLGSVDPAVFLATAERNGVIGFLARHLRNTAAPECLRESVLSRAAGHARASLALTAELIRVLELLAGARVLPYKGPTLAAAAYADPGVRRFTDLDLLVHPGDYDQAARALADAGYEPRYHFSSAQDALFRDVDGDYPFVSRETGTRIELKLRASSRRFGIPLEADALISRAGSVRLAGREVPTLASDDLAIVVCVHAAKHRWERLEWVVCLGELLRRGLVMEEALLDRARSLGAERSVRLGLMLRRRLLTDGDPGPRDARLDALAREAEAEMFRSPSGAGGGAAARLGFALRLSDSRWMAARGFARWMFIPTPEDWKARPTCHPWLAAPARPLRLAFGRSGGNPRITRSAS